MTEPDRFIVIDDKDSRLAYSPGWQSVGGEDYNDQGNYGTTFRNSLHASATDGANMSFSFKGNYARIMGTHDIRADSTGASDPNWQCTIDGEISQRLGGNPGVHNIWPFCVFPDLTDEEHTIVLTVKTRGRNLLLDYVEYRSTATVEGEVIWASRDDSDLWYSEQWPALSDFARYTMRKGSSATFRFIGTGITLYAMYSADLPHPNGEASYSMDGGPSTSFTIPGGGDTTMFNRRIFGVNDLSKQVHTVVITYTGNGDSTPLAISHFYIENGTNLRAPAPGSDTTLGGSSVGSTSTTAPTSGDSSSPAPLPSGDFDAVTPSDASASKAPPIGIVVGAVVGAIAVLLLLLLCTWRWRRRRIRSCGDDTVARAFAIDRERQTVSATPTTLLTTHPSPSALSSVEAPAHHPAARSKRQPAFVQGGTPAMSPHPESMYTSPRPHPPSSPSRSIYHQDSGVRLPVLEAEAVVEHPPIYTVH